MPRSPAALLLLLAPLAGCDERTVPIRVDDALEPEFAAWFPASPFRDDVRLPEASHSQPWQPPAEGPVPVVEILRDGSWFVDGELVEGEGDARREALVVRLRPLVVRMPKERLAPDLDSGPRIPSNPALVRADRDAPWSSLKDVIETCHGWRTQISRVELQVGSPNPVKLHTLSVPMARDFGSVCADGGAWAWTWLLLEAGSDANPVQAGSQEAPSPLTFLLADYVKGQSDDRTRTERFDSAAQMVDRLRDSIQGLAWLEIAIDLPPEAPTWLAVAALDLGTQAGVVLWGFPPLPESPERTW